MKHFLFENREYVIDPVFKRIARKPAYRLGLSALRALKKHIHGGHASRRGGTRLSWKKDTRQRCTVKMHYSNSYEAHKYQVKSYLIKEGAGRSGGKPELYGTPLEQYRANMVKKNFRIFLSPASNTVPLSTLAKTFIKKLELQTGHTFYWVAAEHYDTAHHHVHILINGVDKKGEEIFFHPDLVKTFMRESARTICTSLVGGRTKADMAREKRALLSANRYTDLDENIKRYLIGNRVQLERIPKNRERYIARLDHLRTLGICTWEGMGYVLNTDWIDTLKTLGKYNMFLDARKRVTYTLESEVKLFEGSMGMKQGIVVKTYKTDEVSDNHALLMESIDGKAYFIPLFYKPDVKPGETVEIVPRKNEKGRLNAAIYTVKKEYLYRRIQEKNYRNGYAGYLRAAMEHEQGES
jgi:hypothetical protein